MVNAGDTVYIRGGVYHEGVVLDGANGAPGRRITFRNYNGEKVLLDGTLPLERLGGNNWVQHSGNIYKTTITNNIWQLFIDGRMQVIARWPNAGTHPTDPLQTKPDSPEAADGTWWSKTTTWANADMPGTKEYSQTENNPAYHDLAATGISFEGGSIIYSFLAQGGDGNQERLITKHVAGSNILKHDGYTGPGTKKGYVSSGKYFILEHLNALDQADEWYYILSNKTVYVWGNPTGKEVRGRTITRAFTINSSCSYITLKGLDFFACNFRSDAEGFVIEDCTLLYPDASRRLLGEYPDDSDEAMRNLGTYVANGSLAMTNCVYAYSEMGIVIDNSAKTLSSMHNNLIHHISMLGIGKNGVIQQVNSFTRNTVHTAGSRGAIKTNADPQVTRKQKYNILRNWGYLQVEDGAGFQVAGNDITGCERAYNWVYDALKYGFRWDGHDGLQGLNHHNVAKNMRGAFQIKGDEHNTFNNTGLGGLEKNDFIILNEYNAEWGHNENINSRTWNNLGDRIAGHRNNSVTTNPIPGDHSNNWNGYLEPGSASDQLRDPEHFDFRPKAGADIVDAGRVIAGITDGYIGAAPDIGAYEYGDPCYWIPGYQSKQASHPYPPDGMVNVKLNTDLMYLIGYQGVYADIYFGTSPDNLTFLTRRVDQNNVVTLADYTTELADNAVYFWRVDTVLADSSVITGDVWSFTTEPPVVEVTFPCTADTRCVKSTTNNYGAANPLRIQNYRNYRMYAKFNVTGVSNVQSATLKLHVNMGTIPDIDVYAATGAWEEMTLMGANDTLVWGSLLDTRSNCTAGSTYSFDVSSFVTNSGIYTFAITTDTNQSGMKLSSRESETNGPILIVTGAGSAIRRPTYANWAYNHGLAGSESMRIADLEPDGADNFTEYVFGGNPLLVDATAIHPRIGIIDEGGSQWLELVYRRCHNYKEHKLEYIVTSTTNLMLSAAWNTNDVIFAGSGPIDAGFDSTVFRLREIGVFCACK